MISYQPIAIVGMGGVFPGAPDIASFWNNIVARVDAISEIPAHRWVVPPEEVYSKTFAVDKTFSKRAGTVDMDFDPTGFEIDPDLLTRLDPLYHYALTAAREALGECTVSSVSRERTGVVLAAIALPTVGSSALANRLLGQAVSRKLFNRQAAGDKTSIEMADLMSARVTSLPAVLLAKAFRFGGCAYTLDAACSSSLYAVKLACDDLQAGRADMMIAGGVSRPEVLYTQVGFTQLQALSKSGVCAPFDAKADGLVVGEGAGLFVLKRLDDAVAEGDTILGVIRGIGLSNDMEGNLLSPESEGQVRAMRTAYQQAGWSVDDVGFIECHGTGTPVGDMVELASMRALWEGTSWQPGQCPIGSIKSMVGHLLTGAGAAGMAKVLMGFANRTIPPGVNFSAPSAKSPLIDSPFRVQTEPEPWLPANDKDPLRAAVSSFGFGGINAHLLLEAWTPETIPSSAGAAHAVLSPSRPPDIAVVGMETCFGKAVGLRAFQEALLRGDCLLEKPGTDRWKGMIDRVENYLGHVPDRGAFIDEVSVLVGEFHIPPKEIGDILPQHLLMLKTAAGALADAGMPLRAKRPRMGAVMGMDFDVQANDYHFRWSLSKEADKWKTDGVVNLESFEGKAWLESLKNAYSPPLTASRVVGALGGILASRIAKQFQLGGPGFVVSSRETSGLRALEIGIRSLQFYDTDAFLVGAVDLAGDVQRIIADGLARAFSSKGEVRPFDGDADGPLPGDGAAALVLKRLDDAVADGDRIYCVIKGMGSATALDVPAFDSKKHAAAMKQAYILSLERAFANTGINPSTISLFEAHGSGDPMEDGIESEALCEFFNRAEPAAAKQCALGSTMANIGHTGAAAGLAAFAKAAVCMYQQMVAPLCNFTAPADGRFKTTFFHMPKTPQFWLRNRVEGPRRACVGAMTGDGGAAHVVIEEYEWPETAAPELLAKIEQERRQPLGLCPGRAGLFVVEGDNNKALIDGLDRLHQYIRGIDEKNAGIEKAARGWYAAQGLDFDREYAVAIVAGTLAELDRFTEEAKELITRDRPSSISGMRGICYSTHLHPVGSQDGRIAFVFPGSGNHYLGMGREIGVDFPGVARQLDAEARKLKDRFLPEYFFPWRDSWNPGWEEESRKKIGLDPLTMIIGQVSHGGLMTWLARQFGLKPDAVIGYSLGESAGLFATGAWKHRSEMLDRMRGSDLFTTALAGPCNAAREVWHVPPDQEVDWCVAVVNRSADQVKKAMRHFPLVYLLIVNTPTECVIGGRRIQVEEAIKFLGCEAVFLEGVVTVHCDAAVPAKEDYRALHLFPVTPPEGVTFYSCARGRAIDLTSEAAAQSITDQALYGFDFTQTVLRAYKDGVRVFVEMGPHNSCTRMIQQILADRPHLAVSICNRSGSSYLAVLKCMGTLIAERVPVNLEFLYGADAYPPMPAQGGPLTEEDARRRVAVKTGKEFVLPEPVRPPTAHTPAGQSLAPPEHIRATPPGPAAAPSVQTVPDMGRTSWAGVMEKIVADADATTRAHQSFLEFSQYMNQVGAETFALQAQLLEAALATGDLSGLEDLQKGGGVAAAPAVLPSAPKVPGPVFTTASAVKPAFDRSMCMEFATGSVAKVLGPEFAVVDTYPVRVRLPDEPLMLVDRIVSVEGEKGSLKSGRVVTEHDVHPDAWYLQADRVPVCISIEAGQADLFLCAYLGIDLAVKGRRSYRLLDAVATFHEGLPRSGQTIRYEIEIKKFVRQGETYLFFFEFNGYIGSRHIITMRNGCAGFFTPEEVRASGGIVLKKEDLLPRSGNIVGWQPLVPVATESYTDDHVSALREGILEKCFGPLFAGITLPPSLRLPGGRMRLIDRILSIDPAAGRYGLGNIKAQADIHPDDWFLTCHFVDDMVMPGTLMYQCCEQALRVLLLRMGWVTGREDVCFEPLPDKGAVLKCRGPVTRETRHVLYEIELSEIGYNPEPYVLADAFMYADGERIVMFERMSLKATGLTQAELESFWAGRNRGIADARPAEKPTLYDRDKLLAYAVGKPSEAFGPPYKIFDEGRIIARLPGPPYFFMDRVTFIDHPQWEVKAGGWIEAEYTVRPDDWYFAANRQPSMPFCVLLEIALQPCGWLAAYAGSALHNSKDVKFRNLGGTAIQHMDLRNEEKTLTMRARMTKVAESGGMIIEYFDIEVLSDTDGRMVYSGTTYFGFFSADALARQVGVPKAAERCHKPSAGDFERAVGFDFKVQRPLTPNDPAVDPAPAAALPGKALLMVDGVECWIPDGGSAGLGFIRGIKQVDPDEWFFKAHFYQDPVCPGSLGLESFLQLLKEVCRRRWPEKIKTHRFEFVTNHEHEWIYRGQIIPKNRRVEVEADIVRVEETSSPAVFADGFLKVDEIFIYEMKNFGLRMVPAE